MNNITIFKYISKSNYWAKIDIENVRKNDIVKCQEDNGLYLPNANNGVISLVIEDAKLNDDGEWDIKSIPYPFKRDKRKRGSHAKINN